jgi:hypothetical protein
MKQCFNCKHDGDPFVCRECIHNCQPEVKNDHFEAKIIEIRPEKGDTWKLKEDRYLITQFSDEDDVYAVNDKGERFTINDEHSYSNFQNVIHNNKDGWIRIEPPVEDDNIERIEIEGVKDWEMEQQKLGEARYSVTIEGQVNVTGGTASVLENKPPMKMIIEIPKDKL